MVWHLDVRYVAAKVKGALLQSQHEGLVIICNVRSRWPAVAMVCCALRIFCLPLHTVRSCSIASSRSGGRPCSLPVHVR